MLGTTTGHSCSLQRSRYSAGNVFRPASTICVSATSVLHSRLTCCQGFGRAFGGEDLQPGLRLERLRSSVSTVSVRIPSGPSQQLQSPMVSFLTLASLTSSPNHPEPYFDVYVWNQSFRQMNGAPQGLGVCRHASAQGYPGRQAESLVDIRERQADKLHG